jgi:hypothetical protein
LGEDAVQNAYVHDEDESLDFGTGGMGGMA